MKRNQLLLLPLLSLLLFSGCAVLKPGADPLVVRVEQSETVALATFNAILNVDNANRSFWRTSAPPFHAFCEFLRQPQVITQSPTNLITLPRGSAMLWSLDATKRAYIGSKSYSNVVVSALATVEQALYEAQSWMTLTVTNR